MTETNESHGTDNSGMSIAQALEQRHGEPAQSVENPKEMVEKGKGVAQSGSETQMPDARILNTMEQELGPYLKQLYQMRLPGIKVNEELFMKVAPYGITILPDVLGDSKYLKTDITTYMPKSVWMSLLKNRSPYLLSTDLANVNDPVEKELFEKTFPGYASLEILSTSILVVDRDDIGNGFCSHPYMFAMGTSLGARPYVTAALKKRMDKRHFNHREMDAFGVRNALASSAPDLEFVGAVAEEYGLKDISQIVSEINSLSARYAKW